MSVPVKAHALADPEKGSGIAMICTFGDITDVTWWRELSLPVRAIIQANGALRPVDVGQRRLGIRATPARAQGYYDQLRTSRRPRRARASSRCCKESGDLVGEPRPITHPVKFYEKGDRPLEIVTSRQWFIKTTSSVANCWRGARTASGTPSHMRYDTGTRSTVLVR